MVIAETLHCARVPGNNDLLLICIILKALICVLISFLHTNFITYIEISTQIFIRSVRLIFSKVNAHVVRVWHVVVSVHTLCEPLLMPHDIANSITTLPCHNDPLDHTGYLAVPIHHVHGLIEILPPSSFPFFKLLPVLTTLPDFIDSVFDKHALSYLFIYSI